MKYLASTLVALAALVTLSSCSKEKKTVRQLEGTWDVVLYETEEFYTGECGTPAGNYNEFSASNIGTITFSSGASNFGRDEDAQPGQFDLSYTYTDPGSSTSYPVTNEMVFDWYILADDLIIENPDEFIYQSFDLEEFDKKEWVMAFSENLNPPCNGRTTSYHMEKQ